MAELDAIRLTKPGNHIDEARKILSEFMRTHHLSGFLPEFHLAAGTITVVILDADQAQVATAYESRGYHREDLT
jgi:hypothetical protein